MKRFNNNICEVNNKYLRKKDGIIIIDYMDKGFSYIKNNKDIMCDKIKILNGIGILMYYKDVLVKYIKSDYIDVHFNSDYNTIKLMCRDECLLYIHYLNDLTEKECEKNFTTDKYKIGDIVIHSNIGLLYDNGKLECINTMIFFNYYRLLKEGKEKNIKEKDAFDELVEFTSVEIIDIVDGFYKLKFKITAYNEDYIFYGTDEDLTTIDELKRNCLEFFERN